MYDIPYVANLLGVIYVILSLSGGGNMNIGKTLNLKDYRIIKVLLAEREPFDCADEIGLTEKEISLRLCKIKTFLSKYLKLG